MLLFQVNTHPWTCILWKKGVNEMSITAFILSVIFALVIGTVADRLSPFSMPGSWVGAIVAGYVGTWLGPYLFGTWGPMVVGYWLVPSLIGAYIIVIVVGGIGKFFD
jgi:uncharacterized membrane protein YeaQ/YmgE (transglycosylase-associated protein family)